jgi:hypothetical protein
MFGDNTDKNICDNCNFNIIDDITDIIDEVIDNIGLTKQQISRKITNKKYRVKHSIPIAQKRFMKNKSKRLITDYEKYHRLLYKDDICRDVKPNDFRKIYMAMIV